MELSAIAAARHGFLQRMLTGSVVNTISPNNQKENCINLVGEKDCSSKEKIKVEGGKLKINDLICEFNGGIQRSRYLPEDNTFLVDMFTDNSYCIQCGVDIWNIISDFFDCSTARHIALTLTKENDWNTIVSPIMNCHEAFSKEHDFRIQIQLLNFSQPGFFVLQKQNGNAYRVSIPRWMWDPLKNSLRGKISDEMCSNWILPEEYSSQSLTKLSVNDLTICGYRNRERIWKYAERSFQIDDLYVSIDSDKNSNCLTVLARDWHYFKDRFDTAQLKKLHLFNLSPAKINEILADICTDNLDYLSLSTCDFSLRDSPC